jgi:hypothetical protein
MPDFAETVEPCKECLALVLIWDMPDHMLWHKTLKQNFMAVQREGIAHTLVLR